MKNLVNYAVKYASKGLYVLPMLNKRPIIPFADQPPLNAAEITTIWGKHPYAQIAVRTVDFFVIDIDRHADGADGFKTLTDLNRPEIFNDTLSQTTAGGGKQLIYLKPTDQTIVQQIGWLPGIDVKAHINNYVMFAPSEIKGKTYAWDNHNPIVKPSEELIKLLTQTKQSNYTPEQLQYTGGKSNTADLFEQITNGFGETGGRNMALASFIGGLLFRNVDVNVVYELAKQANSNTPKALQTGEFDRTFESMLKKEIKRREASKS